MNDVRKQIFHNQFWETIAFVAKAAFLFLLTPLMIRQWGTAGYGEFAVASSAMIFFSIFDLGLRGRARIAVCQEAARLSSLETGRVMAFAITRFGLLASLVTLFVLGFALSGIWSRLLNLPSGNDFLIFVTVVGTHFYMITGFFLEPLVAQGRIGLIKLASALGALTALPMVGFVVINHGSVLQAMVAWIGCLTLANLVILFREPYWKKIPSWAWKESLRGRWKETLLDGVWFNLANVNGLLKNQYLVFVLAAVSGTATAGVFFVIVRLSEIISSFGAISCDVGLGALSTGDLPHRRKAFSSIFGYSMLLCLLLAVGIGLFTPVFWEFWLKVPAPLGWPTGAMAAALGLTAALNRIIVYAALPLGMIRKAALFTSVEVVFVILNAIFIQPIWGLGGTLVIASLAIVILIPLANDISRKFEQPFWITWNPRLAASVNDLWRSLRSVTQTP